MRLVRYLLYLFCVILENIQTSPTEGIFSKTPHHLWKFQLSFIHFFKCFGLAEPPTPPEIPIPSVGGVWIFSGTAHCVSDGSRTISIHEEWLQISEPG